MKYIYLIILTGILITNQGFSQERALNHELNSDLSGQSRHYVARESIKLKRGFAYKPTHGQLFQGQLRNFELEAYYEDLLNSATGNSNNAGTIGATQGTFGVGATGAVSYSIPIKVSPGTADMEPSLSIIYSSQSGNGIMGQGFNLSGLSAISRVPAVGYLDGQRNPVDFDDSDKLAIDGDRLIRVGNVRTYGAAGSEYRTENNRFAKIVAYETQGTSNFPKKFKVWEKSGLIKYYGYSSNGQVGNTTKGYHSWLLTRVEDRKGNFIDIEYVNTSSVYFPLKISYGASGLSAYASVEFAYKYRPNNLFYYVGGIKQRIDRQLTKITSKYGSTIFREYELAYDYYEKVPHLTKVTEKNGAGASYNPIKFDWNNGTLNFAESGEKTKKLAYYEDLGGSYTADYYTGDFTGDGVADILQIESGNSVTDRWILNEYDDQGLQQINAGNLSSANLYKYHIGDFNADGLVDFMRVKKDKSSHSKSYEIYHSNGNGFTLGDSGNLNNLDWLYIADFDGNGYPDLLVMEIIYIGINPSWQGYFKYNDSGSFGSNQNYVWFKPYKDPALLDGSELKLGDFNSDGMVDIFAGMYVAQTRSEFFSAHNLGYTYALFSKGRSFERKIVFGPSMTATGVSENLIRGDFNGDGKLDMLLKKRLSKSTGVETYGKCGGAPPLDQANPLFGTSIPTKIQSIPIGGYDCPTGYECNFGTGMCERETFAYFWKVFYGAGTGFDVQEINEIATMASGYTVSPIDINGDGTSELLFAPEASTGTMKIYSLNGRSWTMIESFEKIEGSEIIAGDFTGNGSTDFLNINNKYTTTNKPTCNDGLGGKTCRQVTVDQIYEFYTDYKTEKSLVKLITNSRGSIMLIDYLPLTNDEIYTKRNDLTNNDVIAAQIPMYVVSGVYADDGIGGLSETKYSYEGAAFHRKGRGFLGFQKMTTNNLSSQIQSIQLYNYNNSYFTPLLERQTTYSLSSGTKLVDQSNLYTNVTDGHADTYLFAPSSSMVEKFDPSTGNLLSSINTQYLDYDSYGNSKHILQTYGSGETVNTYNNYLPANTSAWIVSRLENANVTKTTSGETPVTRNSEFEYFPSGLLKSETIEPGHALQIKTSYTYNKFGNIISSTSVGLGGTKTESTTYTSDGRFPKDVYNAMNHKSSFTYDPLSGNMLTSTDPNGLVSTRQYDSFHRPVKVISSNGNYVQTTYSWSVSGGPSSARYSNTITDSDGGLNKFFYDRLGRKLRSQSTGFDGQLINIDQVYNSLGQVVQKSEPYFSGGGVLWHSLTYDTYGRLTKTESPGGKTSTVAYDRYTTTSTNAEGQSNIRITNAMDQLVTATDANGKSMTYTYYSSGLLKDITDPKLNKTSMAYDKLGNNTQFTDPDLGLIKYEFNAFGELTKQTDAENHVMSFVYDELGRTKSRTVSGAGGVENTSWIYDTKWIGSTSSISGPNNTSTSYTYDPFGRLTEDSQIIESQPYNTLYTYTNQNKIDVLTYPSGLQLKHNYNAQGYLFKVMDLNDATPYWQANYKNAKGQLENFTLGNHLLNVSKGYDSNTGSLKTITTEKELTVLQDMSFNYDLLNNLTSRSDHLADGGLGLTENFTYDELNRLKKSEISGKSYGLLDMEYDELGNIKHKSDVGNYFYEDNAHPHAVSKVTNSEGIIPSITQTIKYTGFNKVKHISEGFSALEFVYGAGFDRKVTKTFIDGSLTQTKIFVGGIYEKEINVGADDREINYIIAGGESVAIYAKEETKTSLHYLLKDHLGSVAGIVDAAGVLIEKYSYDAWGKRRDAETWDALAGAVNQSYDRGFTGHEHLGLFSLINMNGRVYDPVLGRFLSADPFTQFPEYTQSFNRFSYVLNNPLSLTDPSGYLSIGDVVGTILNIAITAVLTAIGVPYPLSAFIGAFVGTFAGSLIDGASVSEAIFAAGMSATISFIAAGIATGVGGINFSKLGKVGAPLARAGTHGLTQGGFSALRGGNFWHGFASGSIGSLSSTSSQGIDSFGAKVAISSAAGGASSAVAGGSFTDGAITGAYVYLFNHHAHQIETNARIRKENRKNGSGALGYQNTNGGIVHQGRLNLEAANRHYRNGKGIPLTIDASILDLSGVDPSIFSGAGDEQMVNILWKSKDGLVHGRLYLIYRGNNKVDILSNKYDFDTGGSKNPWFGENSKFLRNTFTIMGNIVAGPGTPFMIHFEGYGDLNYKPAPFVPQYPIGPKY